jgi:hypothetical protein
MKYILATIALAALVSGSAAENFDGDELLSLRTCQATIEETHSQVDPRFLETHMVEILDEGLMEQCKITLELLHNPEFKAAADKDKQAVALFAWQQLGEAVSWYRGRMFENSEKWYPPKRARQ